MTPTRRREARALLEYLGRCAEARSHPDLTPAEGAVLVEFVGALEAELTDLRLLVERRLMGPVQRGLFEEAR